MMLAVEGMDRIHILVVKWNGKLNAPAMLPIEIF